MIEWWDVIKNFPFMSLTPLWITSITYGFWPEWRGDFSTDGSDPKNHHLQGNKTWQVRKLNMKDLSSLKNVMQFITIARNKTHVLSK